MCFYGAIAAIIIWHTRHRWLTVVAVVVCAAVPLTIAGSRVYRGMHYPTDVLAGWIVGLFWASLCWLVAQHYEVRAVIKAERKSG